MVGEVNKNVDKINYSFGDGKLNKEEISYLEKKEGLWARDVSEGLIKDISETNKLSFQKNVTTKSIFDYLTTHIFQIESLRDILQKSQKGQTIDNLWQKYTKTNNFGIMGNGKKSQVENSLFEKYTNSDEFGKQCVILNMLLSISSINLTKEEKLCLTKADTITTFNMTTVKALHRYQKKYENIPGWSKADCIVGPKTIQQLLYDANIKTTDTVAGTLNINTDVKFSKSKTLLKDSYNSAKEVGITMDSIMKDPALSNLAKTKAMIDVYKKTTTKGVDGLDKRYAAAVKLILNIKNILSMSDEEKKQEILSCLNPEIRLELKKYWNAKNSKAEIGVKKTDDIFGELEKVEVEKENWLKKSKLALGLALAWKQYLIEDNDGDPIEKGSQIDGAIKLLQKYQKYDGVDHSKSLESLLSQVLVPSKDNEHQKYLLSFLPKIFTAADGTIISDSKQFGRNTNNTESFFIKINRKDDFIGIVSQITQTMRKIDKSLDGSIFDKYASGESITDIVRSDVKTNPRNMRLLENSQSAKNYNKDMNILKGIFDVVPNDKLKTLMRALDKTVVTTSYVGGGYGYYAGTEIQSASYDSKAITEALASIGLTGIADTCKKEMREKYKGIKDSINKESQKAATTTISKITSSIDAGIQFHRKQGNSEVVAKLQLQKVAWENFNNNNGPLPLDSSNQALVNTIGSLGLDIANNDYSQLTKVNFIKAIADYSLQMSAASIFESSLTVGVMDKHGDLLDRLKTDSSSGKLLSLYANIHGVGSAWSDTTANAVITVTKEVIIMIATTVATMGIGSALSAIGTGIAMGAEATALGAEIIETTGALTRIGVNMSKFQKFARATMAVVDATETIRTSSRIGKLAYSAGTMLIEGSAFHFSSTAMSNVLHGKPWVTGLDDWEGYAKTALFLGAFKFVNPKVMQAFDLTTETGIMTALKAPASVAGKTFAVTKSLLKNMGSVGAEFAAMQAVDIPLSLVFDGKMPDMSAENLAQTIGFIMGMRLYGAVKIQSLSKDAAGNVTEIKIRTANGEEMIVSAKTLREMYEKNKLEKNKPISNTSNQIDITSETNTKAKKPKNYMPRERVRLENAQPRAVEKIKELQSKNLEKKIALEKTVSELESKYNDLLKQRETNWKSVDRSKQLLEKTPKLDVLNKKIKNIVDQIKQIEIENNKISTASDSPTFNDYFVQNKAQLLGKDVWIDGNKYTCDGSVTKNGSLNFKYTGGEKSFKGQTNFTIDNFSQLSAKGQVNGFSDGVSKVWNKTTESRDMQTQSNGGELKIKEQANHKLLSDLFTGEKSYIKDRITNKDAMLQSNNTKITELQKQQATLEGQIPKAKEWANKISERAKKGKEIQTEINKLLFKDPVTGKETGDLAIARQSLSDVQRLEIKYEQDLGGVITTKPVAKEFKSQENTVITKEIAKTASESQKGSNNESNNEHVEQKRFSWGSGYEVNIGGEKRIVSIKNGEITTTGFTGEGTIYSEDGSLLISGKIKNNNLDGQGIRNFEGKRIQGIFKEGKIIDGFSLDSQNGDIVYYKDGKNINESSVSLLVLEENLTSLKNNLNTLEATRRNIEGSDFSMENKSKALEAIAKQTKVIEMGIEKYNQFIEDKGQIPPEAVKLQANFENVKSFEELYKELDRVGEITVEIKDLLGRKIEKKFSAEQAKEMIKKGATKYLSKELQSKVEKLNSVVFDIKKCSDQAKEFVNEFGEPKNKIELPDGSVLHVTDILQELGGYKFVVGYALHNGILEPRMFYRSGSEGCRRSCPGKRVNYFKNGAMHDGGYSKAEFLTNQSYETTTKIDPQIGAKFDKFSNKIINNDVIDFTEKFGYNFLENQMKESIKIDQKLFNEYDEAVTFYRGKNISDVINGYNNLIPNGLEYTDMKIVAGKEYSYKHDALGEVNVRVCRTKCNGKDVDIHFANAKNNNPNQVWIENIVYSDAKINSFGVYDKQINAGPLTAKPIDYISQAPYGLNNQTYGKYVDIRTIYQGNPIIKYAKENILSGVSVSV